MFTGIVESIGNILEKEKSEKDIILRIHAKDIFNTVKLGSSVCVSGVCLTVSKKEDDILTFNVMHETISKTTLDTIQVDDKVNLESSLKVGDEIGGHFVFGHVDGIGTVTSIEKNGDSWLLSIEVSDSIVPFLANQGSIAVDGVSLTIAKTSGSLFTVSLVEYTWDHTTLSQLKIGDKVNIEADMLAKYIQKQIEFKV